MNYRIHEPSLHATPVLDLRPTQMTLGMGEVVRKRNSWKSQGAKTLAEFLAHHMVPVVVGPGGRRYLIDHHHLARALHDEGVDSVFVTIVADFHKLDADAFWNIMDFHGWTHPFDGKGRRRALLRPAQDRRRHGGRSLPLARRRIALLAAASPRIRRRSRNSSGPTSCVAASSRRTCARTSARRSTRRWRWRGRRTRATCPAGARPTAAGPPPNRARPAKRRASRTNAANRPQRSRQYSQI